jgi:hypothetical protein
LTQSIHGFAPRRANVRLYFNVGASIPDVAWDREIQARVGSGTRAEAA